MGFTVSIPARLASTRLPNKPLADLGGKPMVVRVAERARLSGAARIIVATDHEDIAAACLWLASPAGSFVTGKVVEVDGGLQAPNLPLGLPDL